MLFTCIVVIADTIKFLHSTYKMIIRWTMNFFSISLSFNNNNCLSSGLGVNARKTEILPILPHIS